MAVGKLFILVPCFNITIVITVGFVEQMYTFVENQGRVRIQVRKDFPSDEPFMVRVRGGENYKSWMHACLLCIRSFID